MRVPTALLLVLSAVATLVCAQNETVQAGAALFGMPGLADKVSALINLARQGQNYIIAFKDNTPVEEFANHMKWLEDQLDIDMGLGRIVHRYDFGDQSFCGYSGTFHPALIQLIQQIPFVEVIDPDHIVSYEQVVTLTQRQATWGLKRIWQRLAVRDGYSFHYKAGRNVDVYILDTGVNIAHTEFGGRAKNGQRFIEDKSDDLNGHGTHVAGTVGGSTYGVAKAVSVVSVKVLGHDGSGPWSGIVAGINWVVLKARETKRPSVINISISGTRSTAVNRAVEAAIRGGVHIVIAAGNKNDDACKYSPASAVGTIVVGAIKSGDTRSSFSNWGSCVTVTAPGEQIMSAGYISTTAVKLMSGTSMASPHVAGAAAVLLSQRNMTTTQLRNLLIKVATPNVIKDYRTPNNVLFLNPASLTDKDLQGLAY